MRRALITLVVLVAAAVALLRVPTTTPLAASDFAPTPFMAMSGATPVHWSTCAPVPYRVNLAGAPPYARAALAAAIGTINRDTGLDFVYAGTTTDVPQDGWASHASGLVVAWATPSTSDLLGQTSEMAIGSARETYSSPVSYDAGVVVVDAQAASDLGPGLGPDSLGLLLLHELSHVVGLAHSHDPASYMYPIFNQVPQHVTALDRTHLAELAPSC